MCPLMLPKDRHQHVWLLCGLAAVVLVVWWWRSCFCSGSRRRISWRRLGVLVWETWQSPISQPRSSTALTGGDNCWRGAPEFPLKLSRALAACPGSSAGEVGRSLFCLVVVCVLAPSFSSSHHEARRKKEKQKLNNKTGWLLHDVGRPITVGRPPNQRRCALDKLPTSSTINLAFEILPPPHDRRQLAKMKLQRQFPSCRLGRK